MAANGAFTPAKNAVKILLQQDNNNGVASRIGVDHRRPDRHMQPPPHHRGATMQTKSISNTRTKF
jgi:hypothetical protein